MVAGRIHHYTRHALLRFKYSFFLLFLTVYHFYRLVTFPMILYERRLMRRYEKQQLASTVSTLMPLVLFLGLWFAGTSYAMIEMARQDVGVGGRSTVDDRTVLINQSDYDLIDSYYTDAHEEAFCAFGETNETHILVEDVVRVGGAEKYEKRVRFSCTGKTWERMKESWEFDLLGDIHTHPDGQEYMSRTDTFNFKFPQSVYMEFRAVYDGWDLGVFTPSSLSNKLDVKIVDVNSTDKWDSRITDTVMQKLEGRNVSQPSGRSR